MSSYNHRYLDPFAYSCLDYHRNADKNEFTTYDSYFSHHLDEYLKSPEADAIGDECLRRYNQENGIVSKKRSQQQTLSSSTPPVPEFNLSKTNVSVITITNAGESSLEDKFFLGHLLALLESKQIQIDKYVVGLELHEDSNMHAHIVCSHLKSGIDASKLVKLMSNRHVKVEKIKTAQKFVQCLTYITKSESKEEVAARVVPYRLLPIFSNFKFIFKNGKKNIFVYYNHILALTYDQDGLQKDNPEWPQERLYPQKIRKKRSPNKTAIQS